MLALALLMLGFAVGFPIGQRSGFTTGSEWSLMHANLLAREAGVFMPVSYKDGAFHVVVKQPRHLYKKAHQLADRYEEEALDAHAGKGINLAERIQLAQGISLTP